MGKRKLPGLERKLSNEVREEIRFYLEERARELQEQGLPEEEAWRAAVEAFGNVEKIEAEVRAINEAREGATMTEGWVSALRLDVKYALRSLRRNPGFTAVALLTLSLGLGANTAIYGLLHAALFTPPPVESPDELVAVYTTSRRGAPRSSTSYPDFLDYAERATLLEGLAGTASLPASLGDEAHGARFLGLQIVTGNFFDLLGMDAARGRLITPDDDRLGAGEPVLVLSHRLWRDHFLGDPNVVGATVRLNGQAFTVIGITEAEFRGMSLSFQPDAWIPMQAAGRLAVGGFGAVGRPNVWEARATRWMGMSVGRMTDDASVEQVRDQLFQISEGLKASSPDERGPRNTTVDPLSSYALPNGSEAQMTQFVWLLLGVVGFTLLLACANLANLLLARATGRTREVAVRLALGSGRGRLVRQLLIESIVLAALGGVLGLAVASGMLELLGRFELPGGVTIAELGVGLDGPILLFAAGLAVLTGVVFGLAPTLQATRPDLVPALKGESSVGHARGGNGLRKGLVATQVALCLLLLIGSGLFVQTLREGLATELGFDSEGVALARINLGLLNYSPSDAGALIDELRARLSDVPGVTSVSASTRVPFQNGGAMGFFATVDGYELASDEELRIDAVFTSTGYLESVGFPLIQGRAFSEQDVADGVPVTIINRSMAERYWHGESPLGRTVALSGNPFTVVGVTSDAKWSGITDEATNYMFFPLEQQSDRFVGFMTIAARTAGDPLALTATMRDAILALEADAPITMLQTMEDQVRSVLMPQEMGAVLLSAFGLLALTLATIGIAGVVTYTVNQQRREIGIRLALGAERASVIGFIAKGMILPVTLGVVVGLLGAAGLTRSIRGLLVGVSGTDPRTYVLITAGLLVVTAAASLVPARRASKVDPLEALRNE